MLVLLLGISLTVVGIGLLGLMTQRNLIKILLSIEIMFIGVMMAVAFLALVASSPILPQFVVIIIAFIAALEEAVGVFLVCMVKNITGKIDAETLSELRG